MKFLKPIIFTTLSFFALITTVIISSCEKNDCNNVNCLNGGSCTMGVCRCPTGYEDTYCQFKSVDRFTGMYVGYSLCDNGAQVYDTVVITEYPNKPNYVVVDMYSIKPKRLVGYTSNNESLYTIRVTNNDSLPNYARIHTITLQSDKKLVLHAYNHLYADPADSSVSKCTFTSYRKY